MRPAHLSYEMRTLLRVLQNNSNAQVEETALVLGQVEKIAERLGLIYEVLNKILAQLEEPK